MVQSPAWAANWFAASKEIPRIFMEPEGSLPHSQASATCPYPGPAQSTSRIQITDKQILYKICLYAIISNFYNKIF